MRLLRLVCVLLLAACVPSPAYAQAEANTKGEIDLDIRTRLPAEGRSRTALYTGDLRLDVGLRRGWKLDFYGTRRYGSFLAQQALLEKQSGADCFQIGMVSLPFGIHDTRETYASGLIDYPLARVDYGLNSVSWGVPGVAWSGGSPRLQAEAAIFSGRSSGVWNNANIVGGGALRLQTYAGGVILGTSYWDGFLQTGSSAQSHFPVHIGGFDLRYTQPHLLVRGEYLLGTTGTKLMHGWYLDCYYHLPKYQQVTLVTRVEEMRPGMKFSTARQVTLGLRYVLSSSWTLAVNWRRNNGPFYRHSWTPAAQHGGDLFFQVYRKVKF